MQPLNRAEFAVALKKGLGRVWLHVANYGLDDVADLVLEACLHNQNYDPQCESIRSPWLFEMFYQTAYHSKFREAILSAFKTETCDSDLEQLCGLIKEMAAHGDEEARQMLKDYAFDKAGQRDDDNGLANGIGVDEWIELTGVEGVIDLARIYGQRLMADPDDRPPDYLGWTNETKLLYQAALLQHAQTEPTIAAYWKYLEEYGAFIPRQPIDRETAIRQRRQQVREEYPLERILADARNGVGKYPAHYFAFGRYATPEDLETVFAALLAATDDKTRVRLLWVFRRAPLPQLDDIIFNWVVSDNEDLREAALTALSQVTDPRVHTLARSKVMDGQLTDALDLFLHNYQSEDARLIELALAAVDLGVDEEVHSLGLSLRNITEQHTDPKLTVSLQWVYENTPCTLCRHGVVKLLDQFQALDDVLLQECLHDAEEDTRAFAQQRLAALNPRT